MYFPLPQLSYIFISYSGQHIKWNYLSSFCMLGTFTPRWNKHALGIAGLLIALTFWECHRCLIKLDWNFKDYWTNVLPKLSPGLKLPNTDGFLIALHIAIIFTLGTSICRVILFNLLQGIDLSSSFYKLPLHHFLSLVIFFFFLDDLVEFIALVQQWLLLNHFHCHILAIL